MIIKTEDLIKKINLVFPDTAPVASTEIPGDSYTVNKYLDGRRWKDVTAKSILENMHDSPESYLSHLSPLGFCYYLPAYMLIVLQEWDEDTRWLYENLPSHLTPGLSFYGQGKLDDINKEVACDPAFLNKIAPLTLDQKRCVADFLSHQIIHEGSQLVSSPNANALKAYNTYWHQFSTPE